MHRLALRVIQVDGSALVVVALDLTQMHTQVVTQLAEFCFTGVLKAELECCRKDDQMLFTAMSMHACSIISSEVKIKAIATLKFLSKCFMMGPFKTLVKAEVTVSLILNMALLLCSRHMLSYINIYPT